MIGVHRHHDQMFSAKTSWGTTYVDQCPLALAARIYRAEWKAVAPPRLEAEHEIVRWVAEERKVSTKDAIRLVLLEEIKNIIRRRVSEFVRGEYTINLWLRASPNLHPPISNGGTGFAGYPDEDGIGGWGRQVRQWEDRADLEWSHT